ncbi:MAG: metal-dependent hydrolase [Chloroflexota bacterium]
MAKLKYYSHSCWSLQQDNVNVLIDPFFRNNPMAKGIPDDLRPTTILLTHGHYDHLGDAIEIAKRSGSPILGIKELADYCKEQGVESIDGNIGGTVKFDFGWVKFVPAWHSSTWTPPGQPPRSTTPNGYVIRFFDHTIYNSGDTGLFYDMKLIGETTPIEIAILPIGGHYTMGVADAAKAVELLAPKITIPTHYHTWPAIDEDPNEFKRKVESQTGAKVVIIQPGGEWEIPASL